MSVRRAIAAAAVACALGASTLGASARAQDPPPAPVVTTRSFDTPDLFRARRLALATLQDLGLALESADPETGTITASRLDREPLRLTVTIAADGDSRIRADVQADYATQPLTDSRPAEQFLTALESALFPPPEIE